MTEHSPFSGTHADSDNTHQEILGGRCYGFIEQTSLLEILDENLGYPAGPSNPLYVNCFNKPPIITNDIPDYPWPTPPPVSTGCYPLRATASTTLDFDTPDGLQVSVNNEQTCFPILDIKLNTQPIINQVMALLVPQVNIPFIGSEGPIDINLDRNGCCCDDMGNYYLGPPNPNSNDSHPGGYCFDGKIGDCVGVLQTAEGCSPPDGYPGEPISWPSIGIRWDNESRDGVQGSACSLVLWDPTICLKTAAKRFINPRVLGIGEVWNPPSELGEGYEIKMVSGGAGWGSGEVFSPVYNDQEAVRFCNEGGGPSESESRLTPGVAGLGFNPNYPGDFVTQKLCRGTVVTVFAQRKYNAPQGSNEVLWVPSYPQPGNFDSLEDDNDKLVLWFSVANALDPSCEPSGLVGGVTSGEDYYRSLADRPPRLAPITRKALKRLTGPGKGGFLGRDEEA